MGALLDFRALQVLTTVCDKGNMTEAARSLGVTQSAISQHIGRIESHIGAPVLDRTLRPIRPTPAGSVLYDRAKRILADLEVASVAASLSSAAPLPELRLGVNELLSGAFLNRLALQLSSHVALRQVSASVGSDADHGEALLERGLDLAIVADPFTDQPGLERHELMSEPFVLLLPLDQSPVESVADLEQLARRLPLIRYASRSAMGAQTERLLRRLRIEAPNRIAIDASRAVFEMVAHGRGWAVMPPLALVHAQADLRRVLALRFPGVEPRHGIWLIARQGALGALPEQLANLGRSLLERHYVAAFRALRLWIGERVEITEQSAAGLPSFVREAAPTG